MLTTIYGGLSSGAIYTLLALGLQVPLTFTGLLNFAHVATTMGAVYLTWWFGASVGLNWIASLLLVVVIGTAVGVATYQGALRPVLRRGHDAVLVTTLGASVIIQGALQVAFGDEPKSLNFPAGSQPFDLFGGQALPVDVALVAVAVAVTAALHFASTRTTWGLCGRSLAADSQAAMTHGVSNVMVLVSSFAIAGLLAGVTGFLVVSQIGASLAAIPNLVVYGFVALAIGGFGSFTGCLLGGVLLGEIEALSSRYTNANVAPLVIFACLLLVLMARPTGLLGSRDLRSV